jgi:hypothetical protein
MLQISLAVSSLDSLSQAQSEAFAAFILAFPHTSDDPINPLLLMPEEDDDYISTAGLKIHED